MDVSIEQMMVRASEAIGRGELNEAVELGSRMIFIAEHEHEIEQNKEKLSLLYSYRAGFRILTKEYDLVIQDCNKAIDLNEKNNNAYGHKCKALIELKRLKEAKEVIQLVRALFDNNKLLIHYENEIDKSWFTTGRAGSKIAVTGAFSFVVGLIINQVSTYSGIAQGATAGVVLLVVFFIRVRRLLVFMKSLCKNVWRRIFFCNNDGSTNTTGTIESRF